MNTAITSIVRRSPNNNSALLQGNSLPSILATVYSNRGILSSNQLDYSLTQLISPSVLPNIDIVCERLYQWIIEKKNICIVGDYDVDGATATTLTYKFFDHCNIRCNYFIPNRFEYGYGLSERIVSELHQQGVDAIITVDNGISSVQGVALANTLGIEVIITDHHLPPEIIPDTPYIINPSLIIEDDNKAKEAVKDLRALAGVGVVFYTLMAFRQLLRSKNWFADNAISEPNLAQYLDLVALGTVADLVPLNYVNRILIAQGMQRIRSGKACLGINAIFQVANKPLANSQCEHIAFAIAPRLNAAGRLTDMTLGVQCLLSNNASDVIAMANELDTINQERKTIQLEMQEEAIADIAALSIEALATGKNSVEDYGMVLFQAHWHQGITGLIAGKVKEAIHLPTIAFAQEDQSDDQNDDQNLDNNSAKLKGSARSVSSIHIKDILQMVDSKYPELILSYGGHAMAAGLSIYAKDLSLFQQAYSQALSVYCDHNHVKLSDIRNAVIYSDGELSADQLTIETALLLSKAGPWGNGFEAPIFDNCFEILSYRLLKDKHLKLTMRLVNGGDKALPVEAIYFFFTDKHSNQSIDVGDTINFAYTLDVNYFRGQENLQLMIQHIDF